MTIAGQPPAGGAPIGTVYHARIVLPSKLRKRTAWFWKVLTASYMTPLGSEISTSASIGTVASSSRVSFQNALMSSRFIAPFPSP